MSNPLNWPADSESEDHVRFRLGVDSQRKIDNPSGTPHHYVTYYVGLFPNPDYPENNNLKKHRAQRSSFPD
eukprot:2561807-Amphidinium_carterae.1